MCKKNKLIVMVVRSLTEFEKNDVKITSLSLYLALPAMKVDFASLE